MALRVAVCRTSEVAPGEMNAFEVDGVDAPLLVANIGGTFHVVTSMCPHEDVSLASGARDGLVITCPGHGYEFDLGSGACLHDPALRLTRYEVTVVGNIVYADLM